MIRQFKPPINQTSSLAFFEKEMIEMCNNEAKWKSSGVLYHTLRNELSNLTDQHCSFCDGFPLNNTSKETIEHYYPKSVFPKKVYDWFNLFYCCDKCQSNANIEFEETVKPDSEEFDFDKLFYFDPNDGEVKVNEYLKNDNTSLYHRANLFLSRYGINKSKERIEARKREYNDLFDLFKNGVNRTRNERAFRYVYDTVLKISPFIQYKK